MRVVWSVLAFEDRVAIFDYIEAESPKAAVHVDKRICEQVENLARSPELGRAGRVDGKRELILGHTPYIAAYRTYGKTITILRILHGAQIWPEEFEQ